MKQAFIKFSIRVAVLVIAAIAFYHVGSTWLEGQIHELYLDRQITVNHVSGLAEKDKGNILLAETLKDNKLVFLGSSELTSPVPENPKNLMPNNLYTGDATYVGHASVQNALHAMDLGANSDLFTDKDVVIVESLQWFTGFDINIDAFFSNFSEMQMYEFLNNEKISEENKKYLCNRYIQLENVHEIDEYPLIDNAAAESKIWSIISTLFTWMNDRGVDIVDGNLTFQDTYIYARLAASNNVANRVLFQILKPYYWGRHKFQCLKDKYDSYKWIKGLSEEPPREVVSIDWNEIYQTAEQEGIEACTNNDIYVYDDYYTEYIEEKWDSLKDRDVAVELLSSKEWDDFTFFLNVCDDLGLQPYIVSMSTNGTYYDYIGMDIEKREALYNKIEQLSAEHGLTCLKTDDKEYEPYFYCDVMHLGWKGWPYVLQNIIEYFSE